MLLVYLTLAFAAGLLVGVLLTSRLKKLKPLTAEDLRDLEVKALLLSAKHYEETACSYATGGQGAYAEFMAKSAVQMRARAADLLKEPVPEPVPVQRIVQFSVHNGGKDDFDPGA